jgi:hypothetical protein
MNVPNIPRNFPYLSIDWGEKQPPTVTRDTRQALDGYIKRTKIFLCSDNPADARDQYEYGRQLAEEHQLLEVYPPFPSFELEDFSAPEEVRSLSEKIERCMSRVQISFEIGSSALAREEYELGKSRAAKIDTSMDFPAFPTY